MIWFAIPLTAILAFAAGFYWPRRIETIPSFLVPFRNDLLRLQYRAAEAEWEAIGGLVGSPAFHALIRQLYQAHVWEPDTDPTCDPNKSLVRSGRRAAVLDLCKLIAAAEQAQKEKRDAAQRRTAERDD